ncbi:MAG: pyridoxamine 5'-phosphate oxidase family protein [Candidatus Krumholzibacteria bacterium]|nr:pyridoxamine 5'-phosphate oxidase family protein [Candidatus Krumholzibacteria bacterium]
MSRYHLRRREREIADPAVLRGLISTGRYAAVALCRGGEPYVVTMNYGFDEGRSALYFHCALEGLKLEFIRANSRACATIVHDLGYRHGECDHAYRSVVLRGAIAIVDDDDERVHGLGVLIDHQEAQPGPVRERTIPGGRIAKPVGILRFDIEEMAGKEGG